MSPIAVSASQPLNTAVSIPLGEYIFRRLRQMGTKSVFGVPGDFNLNFLEHIYAVEDMAWIGCCNELNAGYAADGYAKLSGNELLGVVVTTFGVGELSAINAISGAFAEYALVLHIVGTSALAQKLSSRNLHHLVPHKTLFSPPNHYVYEAMVDDICVAKESIRSLNEACDQVDRVLLAVHLQARPGYLYLPSNFADMMVPASRLAQPLSLAVPPAKEPHLINMVADQILDRLYEARCPALLADVLTARFRSSEAVNRLVLKLRVHLKVYTTTMGKGIIDESVPSWYGTYCGKQSAPGVAASMEEADFVLHVGIYDVETNNGGYSFDLKRERVVELHPEYVAIGEELFKGRDMMHHVLAALLERLDVLRLRAGEVPSASLRLPVDEAGDTLTQASLVETLEAFLRPNDVLVVETCSFLFALPDFKFKKGITFVGQVFYGSIGYAIPATLGSSLALRDLGLERSRRVVLIQGDGSAQMTIQELTTYVRQKIKPTVFLLNNEGYSVERIIHGPTSSYNDIAPNWQWCDLFRVFGDIKGETAFTTTVSLTAELVSVLEEESFTCGKRLQLVELKLAKMDVPLRFRLVCGKAT